MKVREGEGQRCSTVLGRSQVECPEGTVPHGEPVPKQDHCQWGAYPEQSKNLRRKERQKETILHHDPFAPCTTWGGAQE